MKAAPGAAGLALVGAACTAALLWLVASGPFEVPASTARTIASDPQSADFAGESPRPEARFIADQVIRTKDAAGASFIIVDKPAARMFVFTPEGRLLGAAPVLLGAAIGDDTVPGIGERPIAQVRVDERTTPAGRFVGEVGTNARGEDVVWVDYDAAVSIHRVITTNPAERRLERLQTPGAADKRISYGCINVPRAFYEAYVRPAFSARNAIIYVLPDVRALSAVLPLGQHSGASASPSVQ